MNSAGARRFLSVAGTVSRPRHLKSKLSSSSGATKNNKCIEPSIRFFSSKAKRPRIKTSSADVAATWYTSKGPRPKSLEMGRYGLKRLDYSTLEPPVWMLPPQPPTKSTMDRVVFPLTVLITAGVVIWAYMNPEEQDMAAYWKRVETGQILEDEYDDDDDDDWDDDDELD
jgi:hypothetical protein